MKSLPDVMFVVDPRKERIAVAEAIKLNIPLSELLTRTVIRTKSTISFLRMMMQFVQYVYYKQNG